MEQKIKQFKTDKKIVCIYHSIDLDGWMSAAIVKHWFNSIIEVPNKQGEDCNTIAFIGYNYGQPIPDLSKYDKVIMCDISFPKEEMVKIANTKELIWIDHHISALKDNAILIDLAQCEGTKINLKLNPTFAACELTWQYFFPNEPTPEIVRLLGMYDSFRHKDTNEEYNVLIFQYAARAYIENYEDAYEFLVSTKVFHDSNNEPNTIEMMMLYGSSIYKYLCTEAKQTYKNGFEIFIGQSSVKLIDLATIPDTEPETLKNAVGTFLPYKFICINKERFNPINFGIDYHKDGYDGCACFWYNGKQWKFSLYNDNGLVDCSSIAKQFNGGGHKGAAGFVTDNINSILNLQ